MPISSPDAKVVISATVSPGRICRDSSSSMRATVWVVEAVLPYRSTVITASWAKLQVGRHLGHPLADRACGGLMSDHVIDVVQRDSHCVEHFVEQQGGVGHGRLVDASGIGEHSRGWLIVLGVGQT